MGSRVSDFLFRFRQFGGFRLLKEYARLGILPTIVKGFIKRKPTRTIYFEAMQKLEPFLMNKYMPVLLARKAYYEKQELDRQHSNIVWFSWLQGLEQAPPIVKVCYQSLKQNLTDREIKVIDENNWRDYVNMPEHIIRRWELKQMPPAHFSDFLRLQLLTRYGGTWIDSTVLCTGAEHAKMYLDADLFVFQYTPIERFPDSFDGISSWFITSCSNHTLLLILRDMLSAYWKDYDITLDYYLIHFFFSMLANEFPQEIARMPYGYSVWSITLMHHWQEPFKQRKWDKLTSIVNFHKLAYKVDEKVKSDKGNFYNWILEKYNFD